MFSCASVRECDCIVVNFSRVGFSGEFYISLVSVGTMWVFSMLFLFEKILLFVIRRYCQQGLNSESLSKLRAILAAPAGTITNSLGRTRVGTIAFLLEPECMGPSVRSGDETRFVPEVDSIKPFLRNLLSTHPVSSYMNDQTWEVIRQVRVFDMYRSFTSNWISFTFWGCHCVIMRTRVCCVH